MGPRTKAWKQEWPHLPLTPMTHYRILSLPSPPLAFDGLEFLVSKGLQQRPVELQFTASTRVFFGVCTQRPLGKNVKYHIGRGD